MVLPTLGIEKIFDLPYNKEDFKIIYYPAINMPVIEEAHKHDFFMLMAINDGSGTHTIDFEDYPVEKNMLFFLAPGQAHRWNLTEDTSAWQVMFSENFMLQKAPLWPFFRPDAVPHLMLSDTQHEQLILELELIKKENAASIIQHRLQIVLLLVQRWYTASYPENAAATSKHILNRFLLLLDLHYTHYNQVGLYAEKLHITASYLNQVCKRESGKTAGEYIRERLLLEAKRMLSLTQLEVKEIAYALNFKDTSYFSRFFKKYTTLTPMDFRHKS